LLIAFAATVVVYLLIALALFVAGRRTEARALAGFIPDCIVLFKRLLGDPQIARRRKAALWATVAYLAMPIDLIPDFFPVIGQLDDAIVCGLVLRWVLRGGGPEAIREHWPGPQASMNVVLRVAGA
jgi:uncharacterized membrane protein YkvA (DUF1232 family)